MISQMSWSLRSHDLSDLMISQISWLLRSHDYSDLMISQISWSLRSLRYLRSSTSHEILDILIQGFHFVNAVYLCKTLLSKLQTTSFRFSFYRFWLFHLNKLEMVWILNKVYLIGMLSKLELCARVNTLTMMLLMQWKQVGILSIMLNFIWETMVVTCVKYPLQWEAR